MRLFFWVLFLLVLFLFIFLNLFFGKKLFFWFCLFFEGLIILNDDMKVVK